MKVRVAILEEIGRPRPYLESVPMTVETVDLDPPGDRELLIRIEAAGVCHSDLSVVDGNRPRPVPMVLGHEAAGVVEAVGPSAVGVSEGDHVVLTFVPSCGTCVECHSGRPALCSNAAVANGAGTLLGGGRRLSRAGQHLHHHLGVSGFAEYAAVDRGSAVVIPPDIPFEVAALLGCAALTGFGAVVNTAGGQPGQSLAVVGLGGVGLSAVMAAKAIGMHPIVAVDPIAAKESLALELGADAFATPEEAADVIEERTGGGVDLAIEAAGHPDALLGAFDLIRRGGTAVAVGLPHPDAELRVPALAFAGQGKGLVGSYMGDAAPARDVPRLIALWRAGLLPVEKLHTHTRSLDDLNTAFDVLADGDAIRQLITPHQTDPHATGPIKTKEVS